MASPLAAAEARLLRAGWRWRIAELAVVETRSKSADRARRAAARELDRALGAVIEARLATQARSKR